MLDVTIIAATSEVQIRDTDTNHYSLFNSEQYFELVALVGEEKADLASKLAGWEQVTSQPCYLY